MKLIISLVILIISLPAFPNVSKILNESNKKISLDFQKDSSRYTSGYLLQNEIFKVARSKMNQNQFNEFMKWYYGSFFYGITRTVRWNLRGQYPKIKYFTKYDQKGDRPLEGYMTAKKYTKSFSATEITAKTLSTIQRKLVSKKSITTKKLKVVALDRAYIRNSEGAKDWQLDKKREYNVFYNAGFDLERFHRTVGTRSQFRNIKWSKPTNPYVKYRRTKTTYLNPADHFKMKDCLRRQIPQATCQAIKKNMAEYKAGKWPSKMAAKAYQDWIIGYINEALRDLKISLKNARTNWDVIKAASRFQYTFISVHPFGNGNGRTSRVILEKILEDYNLPPPITYPMGIDVSFSVKDYATIVGDATAVSKKFHEDLLALLKNNIPYSYVSAHYLAPGLLPWKMIGTSKVVPKEYMAWLMQYKSQTSISKNKWSYSITDSIKEFIKWRKKVNPKTLKMFYTLTKLPKQYRKN